MTGKDVTRLEGIFIFTFDANILISQGRVTLETQTPSVDQQSTGPQSKNTRQGLPDGYHEIGCGNRI